MGPDAYKSEVIDPGDAASRIAKDVCYKSHDNCQAVTIVPHQPDNFRGPVGYCYKPHILEEMLKNTNGHWVMLEEIENDGAGGKPQFFTLAGTPEVFGRLGWEVIVMTVDDFARTGRFPCVIANAVDTKSITSENLPLFTAMMRGYGSALEKSGLVNITGEVAIMKHSITAFCDMNKAEQLILCWGATCTGLNHRDLFIDGSRVKPGMPIVGFWEPGYRCNGGTFFTNLLLKRFGPDIENIINSADAMEFVRKLTIPSKSYARTVCRIIGWTEDGRVTTPKAAVMGIAHITGGGLWKLQEILPPGVGANLNEMPKPAEVLREGQELSWGIEGLRLTDSQAHTSLHGGCGKYLICAAESDASAVIHEASQDGIQASVVGYTTHSDARRVTVLSRFKQGGTLHFDDTNK